MREIWGLYDFRVLPFQGFRALRSQGCHAPIASLDRPAVKANARLCPPPKLPACGVQVAFPAERAKVRWIVGATIGQRCFVVNFHRQGHPIALHAKPAQRFALENGLPQPLPWPAGLSFARVHHAQIAFNLLAGLWPPDKRQNRQNPTKPLSDQSSAIT